MRAGEIGLLTTQSIQETQDGKETLFWSDINGTKTDKAIRTIPITRMTAYAVRCYCELKTHRHIKTLQSHDYS